MKDDIDIFAIVSVSHDVLYIVISKMSSVNAIALLTFAYLNVYVKAIIKIITRYRIKLVQILTSFITFLFKSNRRIWTKFLKCGFRGALPVALQYECISGTGRHNACSGVYIVQCYCCSKYLWHFQVLQSLWKCPCENPIYAMKISCHLIIQFQRVLKLFKYCD